MNPSRVKILLFLLISAVAIPLLIIALQRFNIFTPNAAGATPKLIVISNLTDSSATITWTTSTSGTLTNFQWGESTFLGSTETDLRDKRDKTTKPRTTHFVQLTGLQPETTYYYRIVAGDNTTPATTEAPSTFKTLSKSSATQTPALTVYGDISSQDTDVIILTFVPDSLGYANVIPLSTLLNADGTWFLNIAAARKVDGTLINPPKNATIALLGIGPEGKGSIKSYTIAESPITLSLSAALAQTDLDKVLLIPPTSITPTVTPTPTTKGRQDFPLKPFGTTATPTGSITVTATPTPPEDASITREQLIASFVSPSVSNVTDTSLSIMFVTSSPAIGTLNWGGSATSLSSNRLNDRDSAQATSRYIHHYTLIGLASNYQYFFRPTIETTVRTFTTPATISAPSGQTIITGSLTNGTGECLVRTQVQRNSILSSVITTLPNSLNTWAINVMPVRTSALDTFMVPVATDTVLINAFCLANNGDAYYQTATTTVQNAVTSGISLTLVKLQ